MFSFILNTGDIDYKQVIQRYVVFEGILCSGKTTMLDRTKNLLQGKKLKVDCFEEAAEPVRRVFRQLPVRNDYIDGLLFAADTLIQNELIKTVPLDTMILEERSILSTLVYQEDLPVGTIYNLHQIQLTYDDFDPVLISPTFRFPELVIVLDVSPEEAIARAKKENEIHQLEKWDSMTNLAVARGRYKQLVQQPEFPFKFHVIKEQGLEETWKEVKSVILEMLNVPLTPFKIHDFCGKRIY